MIVENERYFVCLFACLLPFCLSRGKRGVRHRICKITSNVIVEFELHIEHYKKEEIEFTSSRDSEQLVINRPEQCLPSIQRESKALQNRFGTKL